MSPLVPKGAQEDDGILLVSIESSGLSGPTVTLTCDAWSQTRNKGLPALPEGEQTIAVNLPLSAEPVSVYVNVATSEAQQDFGPFVVPSRRQWIVYLAQHTHTDIG